MCIRLLAFPFVLRDNCLEFIGESINRTRVLAIDEHLTVFVLVKKYVKQLSTHAGQVPISRIRHSCEGQALTDLPRSFDAINDRRVYLHLVLRSSGTLCMVDTNKIGLGTTVEPILNKSLGSRTDFPCAFSREREDASGNPRYECS